MSISLTNIINDWIPDQSKVIDFGCGDGSLLKELIDTKKIHGYGVEIDSKKIQECIAKGLSVIQQDIDDGFEEFESSNFDISDGNSSNIPSRCNAYIFLNLPIVDGIFIFKSFGSF